MEGTESRSYVVIVCVAVQRRVGRVLANRKLICLQNVDAPFLHTLLKSGLAVRDKWEYNTDNHFTGNYFTGSHFTGSHFFSHFHMSYSFMLFAQDAPVGDPFPWLLVMLPAVLVLMWFLMVSPQKKQEQRLRNMLNSLEKNDRVMTVGGLIGTVHSIDKEENEIVLKVDDANNTKVRFHLTAVNAVFPKEGNDKK